MSGFHGYGNLTGEPQGQQAGDSYVVRFRVASNDSYVKNGQRMDAPPVFTKVEYWGRAAQAFETQARQGTPVVVIGDWRASEWETNDGEKRRQQFVRATAVGIQPMPAKTESPAASSESTTSEQDSAEPAEADAAAASSEGDDDFFGGDE